MRGILWSASAWDDYLYWQNRDRAMLRRINRLIESVRRTPSSGEGKPEPLRGDLSGWWSRRIDRGNRLVYHFDESNVYIEACRGHYGD